MQILLLNNSLKNTVAEGKPRFLSLNGFKDYFEKKYNISFDETRDGSNIIYTYDNMPDQILCLRTLKKIDDMNKWVQDARKLINDFSEKYEDAYFIVHVGLGGRSDKTYYDYPIVKAFMHSNVDEDKVIFYSMMSMSASTFHGQTSEKYRLITLTDTTELMDFIYNKILD